VVARWQKQARSLGLRKGPARDDEPRPRPPPREVPGLAVRKTAASILRRVIERGAPLDSLLDESHGSQHFQALEARDRALVRAILGAALRHRGEIEAALAERLDRPLPPNSGALAAILQVAAAQMLFLDVPDHAAVHLAVAHATGDRQAHRARGLVNGVLRRLARDRDIILARPNAARLNTPDWLFARWSRAYGTETATVIAASHLEQPSLDISVKADAAAWADRLGGLLLPTGSIRLAEPHRVFGLPGYAEGAWWVQDAAAALPARLLGNVAGKRVADLCAAPGGKTAGLANAGADVTAVDISESRLKRLAANLERLGLSAQLEAADLLEWTPGRNFDAVLLDAPCTATGTIRRHPDIAWLKRPEDIPALSALQAKMLNRAASLVAPGGGLVFSTCSLEPEEGEAHVGPFLARHPGFALEPVAPAEIAGLARLLTPQGALRTLPCHNFDAGPAMSGMDGFFAARFRRA
jgi:16S rRNA (cytosine967-C5)-methyltransferase